MSYLLPVNGLSVLKHCFFYTVQLAIRYTCHTEQSVMPSPLVIPSVGVSRSRVYLFINFYRAYSLPTLAYYFLRYTPLASLGRYDKKNLARSV